MNDTTEQNDNSIIEGKKNYAWLAPYQYKKGQSGNPTGRVAKGESLKEYAKRRLANMTDEEKEEFMNGLSKDIVWKMGEGNPKQDTEFSGKEGGPIQIAVVKYDNSTSQVPTEDVPATTA